MKTISKNLEFEWNKGNSGKNLKHDVTDEESEEAFFDDEGVIYEERFILLGKTKTGRLIYVVFTFRKNKIRVISARDINKKEVVYYEKAA